MRTNVMLFSLAALMVVVLPRCGDNDGGKGTAVIAKMRSCGLISAGRLPDFEEPDDGESNCEFDCALAASCADLTAILCQQGTISASTALCFNRCEGVTFDCADGSNSIPEDWVCDGDEDCGDGSDEAGCPSFDCVDGSDTIPEEEVCDGWDDCTDGSDEEGCTNMFDCVDGSDTILEDWVCDGHDHCTDGSDEVGCTNLFDCVDGSDTIDVQWVCNGEPDCEDASDEVGCPAGVQFQCADGSFIPVSQDCDDDVDCPDGSDEVGCAEFTCPLP